MRAGGGRLEGEEADDGLPVGPLLDVAVVAAVAAAVDGLGGSAVVVLVEVPEHAVAPSARARARARHAGGRCRRMPLSCRRVIRINRSTLSSLSA